MSDAATETLKLIRHMDTEDVDTTSINNAVAEFLRHITWLFLDGGVLQIKSHTSAILEWFEKRVRHFEVNGCGYSLGGAKVDQRVLDKAIEHLKTWVHMAVECLAAEFPAITTIQCFSAFTLPRFMPKEVITAEVETKLWRLERIFKQRNLVQQYKDLWHRAFMVFKTSNFMLQNWLCWRMAIRDQTASARSRYKDVCHVIIRGQAFVNVTSKIEQSFSKVQMVLTEQRLHCKHANENMYIDLLMINANEAELNDLVTAAQAIWSECFPGQNARIHTTRRNDAGAKHKWAPGPSTADKPTEKAFLKRMCSQISDMAAPSCSPDSLVGMAKPSVWTDSHEQEVQFQRQKLMKRTVDAHMHGHLLPSEHTHALDQAAADEDKRQAASLKKRVNAKVKYERRTLARPPSTDMYYMARIFLDKDLVMPSNCLDVLYRNGATTVSDEWAATMFLSNNPLKPNNTLITWAACLRGCWVVSPDVVLGKAGPSIKYFAALNTRRQLFVTPLFRQKFLKEWHILLELLATCSHKWIMLTGTQWARARAVAELKKNPATVIAFMCPEEQSITLCSKIHCFDNQHAISFLAHADPNFGSLGLLGM